jgi:hypothetical protein
MGGCGLQSRSASPAASPGNGRRPGAWPGGPLGRDRSSSPPGITQHHLRSVRKRPLSARALTTKDFVMTYQPAEPRVSAIRDVARPPVSDRAAFQAELDRLRVREKAHTRHLPF